MAAAPVVGDCDISAHTTHHRNTLHCVLHEDFLGLRSWQNIHLCENVLIIISVVGCEVDNDYLHTGHGCLYVVIVVSSL
jgi:hypothetical protein